jgi:transposase
VELRGESLSIQEIADRYGIGYFRVYRAYTGGRLEALIDKVESKTSSTDL